MPRAGEYREPKVGWVRDQLAVIDATGDTRSVTAMGPPIVVLTIRGATTNLLRRVPVMRVEWGGTYAAVGSFGGAPRHPAWAHSIRANPQVEVHDGTAHLDRVAREAEGRERERWWALCVTVFPPYAEYQMRAAATSGRLIPVFLCEPQP